MLTGTPAGGAVAVAVAVGRGAVRVGEAVPVGSAVSVALGAGVAVGSEVAVASVVAVAVAVGSAESLPVQAVAARASSAKEVVRRAVRSCTGGPFSGAWPVRARQ